jgi:hypothetical protein
MRPLPPEFPTANLRWALDVLSLRRFFSSDPLDTLNQTRVFAVDDETTLTDEELISLRHLGRLTPEGVREFAAEREARLRAFRARHRGHTPILPATDDRLRAAAAAAGAGPQTTCTIPAHELHPVKGPSKRGK